MAVPSVDTLDAALLMVLDAENAEGYALTDDQRDALVEVVTLYVQVAPSIVGYETPARSTTMRTLSFLVAVPILLLVACSGKDDTGIAEVDSDGDGSPESDDCDDAEPAVYPGATEVCDGLDNDCNDLVDDGVLTVFYTDADADGYGELGSGVPACDAPSGLVDNDADCDDADGAVSPDAVEFCDTVDNDCDGTIDEDDAVDALTWYADTDGDGYGDEASTSLACDQPSGFVADATDCDDDDAFRYSVCFTDFDGTYGSAWETLAVPSSDTYSLMVYQPDDIDDIYNMYSNSSGAAQAYDPSADTWTTQSSTVPYNRPWTSMAPWDGDLWMVRNSAVYRYEVATDTWTTAATTTASDDRNMTESDEYGVIYGYDSTGNIVEYDTTTSTVSYHPTGVGGEYETRLGYDPGTRGIFFGAYHNNTLYRYDIATGAVTTMTSHPEGQLSTMFCSDRSGHIYAAGGGSGATIYQYDVATDAWSQIVDLPSNHGNNGSCAVSSEGWLYVGTGSERTFYRLALY